jgi:hypothetical protein
MPVRFQRSRRRGVARVEPRGFPCRDTGAAIFTILEGFLEGHFTEISVTIGMGNALDI